MNIYSALKIGTKILKKNNIRTAQLDSEILMCEILKKKREYVILNSKEIIYKDNLNKYYNLINSRSSGKPIAYIINKKEFCGNEFVVNESVLIPRPDTEIIIDQILKLTLNKSKLNLLDIGVGSGCILLSILKEKKDFYGTGIDISKNCIDISKINTQKMGLGNRLKFFKSDVDNFNYGKYDLIISNPPYINKLDLKYLEKDVISFEPKLALDGGLDGLSEIRKVVKKSSELVKLNGTLILEIAFDQKDKVKELLKKKGFYIKKIVKDFANKNRCIISKKIN